MKQLINDYLKTAFRWQQGRQGSGYDKMLLITSPLPIPFDSYLIRYPVGSFIPTHTDPVSDKRHFRLNIVLKPSQSGGEFICEKSIIDLPRIKLFRPDKYAHAVTEVQGNARYILSIGWVLK